MKDNLTEWANLEESLALMRARRDFTAFIRIVNPQYTMKWFHRKIATACQKVFDGEIKKLMVFVPPQHGKSEITSRLFPAFALGANPKAKIVGCSYSADLALQFSRSIQRNIESDEYRLLFPDTYLKGSIKGKDDGSYTRTSDYFETVGHKGFYKAVGVGGSLTGTPADIAIIDDPVKDREDAYSPSSRDSKWEWYLNVLLTRLHNNSRQIFIMTRWHDDDLAGRILKAERDKWTVVKIPAIREDLECEDDPRMIGEALWEDKHSLEKLQSMRALSERTFAALYQQRPVIDGGNIIKADWFGYLTPSDLAVMKREPVHFFIDTAYTEKTSNDPTGIIGATRLGHKIVITSAIKVYKPFPDLIRFLPEYVRANGYKEGSSIRIEPKANGISVVQQLKDGTSLNVCRTPTPSESKETRLNVASPYVECGNVLLVKDGWNAEFIDEICGFPNKPHDEYPDLLGYAIDCLGPKTQSWSDADIARMFR